MNLLISQTDHMRRQVWQITPFFSPFSKEAELLLILYNAVNTTKKREVFLNMVWGDEGDYVGRTLDVFISKLRKKLEADSNLKIVNIRGAGYKLFMNV